MDLRLGGKSVLITGGSKGIGFACAAGFAAEGCRIHIAARSEQDLESARKRLTDSHPVEVICHACDLSGTDAVLALGRACRDVDIVVNNAGSIGRARIDEIGPDAWRRAWDLKVFGYIDLTREIYAGMRERGSGVIINIIGLSGERNRPEFIAGTSGNAALMAFTRALGAESVDFGVRVLGINPGRVETERQIEHLHEAAQKRLGDRNRWKEIRAEMVAGLPFKRSARPDEVADLVVFLASDRASYMSATVVTIDAGQSLRPRAQV
jgi:NAD(P)-dependent dehydrogenase (short-subunit alcohol dehydrogenase family)